jgi:signal transduction histidine kinase
VEPASGERPSRWSLEVQDEGIGIGSDDLPHVFDRSFRAASARAHRPEGSGLGLHIAQALVRSHGGDIVVTSQPGHGTLVRVQLPLHEGARGEAEAA